MPEAWLRWFSKKKEMGAKFRPDIKYKTRALLLTAGRRISVDTKMSFVKSLLPIPIVIKTFFFFGVLVEDSYSRCKANPAEYETTYVNS